MIDASYTADAVTWLFVWTGLGVAGRILITAADRRRDARRQEHGHGHNPWKAHN